MAHGATAKIDEFALAVKRDVFVRWNRCDDLGLVMLADRLEEFHGLVARPHLAHHRQIALRKFGHAQFDPLQIFRRKGPFVGEIVMKPFSITGPIVTCASGNSSLTAYARRCAVEWRITSRPSASRSVTIARWTSPAMQWLVSTKRPSTFPASAAFARPAPIDAATSATVTGASKLRMDPSGSVMFGMIESTQDKKKCGQAALFRLVQNSVAQLDRAQQQATVQVRKAMAFCSRMLVGAIGLEPTTPTMSRWCSNQLSYAPTTKTRIIEAFSRLSKTFQLLAFIRV